MNGLDVCSQQNSINWPAVKAAGIEFIIPRTGRGITLDDNGMDYRFLEYVKGAQAAGISIPGVFHFIYVHSMEDALKNAQKAVECVQKAGLPKSTVIWCDQEEPTVVDAVKHGFNLTTDLQRKVTEIFCNYCLAQGYPTGVYLNHDYLHRVYGPDIVNEYDIWYEDHTNAHPEQPCLYRQYDWHGRVNGISTDVDWDTWIGTYTAGTAKPKSTTSEEKTQQTGGNMSKIKKFIAALKKNGDGRYHYWDGTAQGIGCSDYTVICLREAGVINSNESFHAGNGVIGVLADTSRFQRLPWNPATLQEGDIQFSRWYHVNTWDGTDGVYEAAPEGSHGVCDNGKTGVGHWSHHGYRNCGNGTMTWDCIYRIIDSGDQSADTGKIKSKTYVSTALGLLKRALAYKNQYPYNCGLLDSFGTTWGDCWNINPKTTLWSLVLGEPIDKNQVVGPDHVQHVYTAGIQASGLPDCTGDEIINKYCDETTFSKMVASPKAPCFLLINGQHMGAYLDEFEMDGKIYNVSEFSPNANLGGKMRSYVDEYGQRLTCKGGSVIGSWNRCGYLTAYIDYSDWDDPQPAPQPTPAPTPDKSVDILAMEVYAGLWGNNPGRKQSITAKYGSDMYDQVQKRVDQIVSGMNWYKTEIKIAEEILAGKWSVNPDRQTNITLKYGAVAYRIAQGFVNDIDGSHKYTIDDLWTAYSVAGGILSRLYGDGEERRQKIRNKYGETIRSLAQSFVNEIMK